MEKEVDKFKREVSSEEQALRERVKEVLRDLGVGERHGNLTNVAKLINVSSSAVKKWLKEPGGTPEGYILTVICKVSGVNANWLLFGKGPKNPDSVPVVKQIAGEIKPADLKLLNDWVMEQEEPARMAANIRFMVETRYPEFEEWQKKSSRKSGWIGAL
jgi:hypothetical protein